MAALKMAQHMREAQNALDILFAELTEAAHAENSTPTNTLTAALKAADTALKAADTAIDTLTTENNTLKNRNTALEERAGSLK